MKKIVCVNCTAEFDEDAENKTEICPACHKKLKSDIQIFQTLKILFLIFALTALSFFIPLSVMQETSPGSYVWGGRDNNPVHFTESGVQKLMIGIVILSIIFAVLGFWFRAKQNEKESVLQNDDHPMR